MQAAIGRGWPDADSGRAGQPAPFEHSSDAADDREVVLGDGDGLAIDARRDDDGIAGLRGIDRGLNRRFHGDRGGLRHCGQAEDEREQERKGLSHG